MSLTRILPMLILSASLAAPSLAQPFLPASEDTVLERVPLFAQDAARAELRALQRQLAQQADNADLAVTLARRYLEMARREADPRYLGYAQAALAHWRNETQTPVEIRVIRALIHQTNHDFKAALTELGAVLEREPRHAQARFTRAAILQVLGDYPRAKRDCAQLALTASATLSSSCLASILSVNGEANQAYALLLTNNALPEPQWLHGLLAEISVRRNDHRTAEEHFRLALTTGDTNPYLLASYSDFLLDQHRPREVIDLLRGYERIDGLLLRLSLAEHELNAPRTKEHIEILRTRFNDARARESTSRHLREEARFTLQLLQDSRTALRLALENWTRQREPADARLVLEAAVAAKQPDAARAVLEWLNETRLQDPVITRLIQKIRTL